jgi:FkbM family methyltransferase
MRRAEGPREGESEEPPAFVLHSTPVQEGPVRKLARSAGLARRLAGLGTTRVDRARLFAAPFVFSLARTLRRPDPHGVTVSISAFGRSARCTLADSSQLLALEAIFLDGDYAIEPLRDPQTIVDLGSNVGLSILYFRLRFPRARIVGVEPDPVAFERLLRNVGPLPDVTVSHAAVGDHDSTATFWSSPDAVASALERTHDAQQPVEVPLRRLETLLDEAAIERADILKLVVEGSEFRALRSLDDLTRLDAITGEIVFVEGDPERSADAFRRLLADHDVSLHEDKGDGFWQFHAYQRVAAHEADED